MSQNASSRRAIVNLTDPDLNAIGKIVFDKSTWSHDGWGYFGNCSFQQAYRGISVAPADMEQEVKRAIYGRRGIAFDVYVKTSLKRLQRVTTVDAVYENIVNHTAKKDMNDAEKGISHKLRQAVDRLKGRSDLAFFTGTEAFGFDDEFKYAVAAIVDLTHREILVAATGDCEQIQEPEW